jgi:hypothetical protein
MTKFWLETEKKIKWKWKRKKTKKNLWKRKKKLFFVDIITKKKSLLYLMYKVLCGLVIIFILLTFSYRPTLKQLLCCRCYLDI